MLPSPAERLARVLRDCEQWMYDANDPLGTFERIADAYYRDTGYLRPGKDSRGYNTNSQENNDRFGKWCVAKQLALLTECCTALAEHDASASAQGDWQPITTAPKDGRQVLLHLHSGQFICGEWNEFAGGIQGWEIAHNMDGKCHVLGEEPTHWMPLPAAPAAAVPCLVCGGYKTACKEAVQNICLCPTVAPKGSGAVAWRYRYRLRAEANWSKWQFINHDENAKLTRMLRDGLTTPDLCAVESLYTHPAPPSPPAAPLRAALLALVEDMRARNCGAAPGDIQRWAERIESLAAQQGDGNV